MVFTSNRISEDRKWVTFDRLTTLRDVPLSLRSLPICCITVTDERCRQETSADTR